MDSLIHYEDQRYKEFLSDNLERIQEDSKVDDSAIFIVVENEVFEVHRLILETSSGFFKRILSTHASNDKVQIYSISLWNPSIFIYLKEYGADDIRNIVQYLYTGEVMTEESNFLRFTNIAKELELFGFHSKELEERNMDDSKSNDEDYDNNVDDDVEDNETEMQTNQSRKRRRSLAPEQKNELENFFQESSYLDANDQKELSIRTELSEDQIKMWFNNRRFKARKMDPRSYPKITPLLGRKALEKISYNICQKLVEELVTKSVSDSVSKQDVVVPENIATNKMKNSQDALYTLLKKNLDHRSCKVDEEINLLRQDSDLWKNESSKQLQIFDIQSVAISGRAREQGQNNVPPWAMQLVQDEKDQISSRESRLQLVLAIRTQNYEQVVNILNSNPSLMAAFIQQRPGNRERFLFLEQRLQAKKQQQQRQQQQQSAAGGQQFGKRDLLLGQCQITTKPTKIGEPNMSSEPMTSCPSNIYQLPQNNNNLQSNACFKPIETPPRIANQHQATGPDAMSNDNNYNNNNNNFDDLTTHKIKTPLALKPLLISDDEINYLSCVEWLKNTYEFLEPNTRQKFNRCYARQDAMYRLYLITSHNLKKIDMLSLKFFDICVKDAFKNCVIVQGKSLDGAESFNIYIGLQLINGGQPKKETPISSSSPQDGTKRVIIFCEKCPYPVLFVDEEALSDHDQIKHTTSITNAKMPAATTIVKKCEILDDAAAQKSIIVIPHDLPAILKKVETPCQDKILNIYCSQTPDGKLQLTLPKCHSFANFSKEQVAAICQQAKEKFLESQKEGKSTTIKKPEFLKL